MDDFFHMHNRMAQQFFAQADRDFQRFLEPPRPVRQHPVREQRRQQHAYRARRSDAFTNAYREPRHQNRINGNNNSNNNRSRRTNNNDVRRKHNNNNNRSSNQSTYQRKPQKFDRGTLKREGILAARPSTSSSSPTKQEYLPIKDRQRVVRSTTPSSGKTSRFQSSKTPPRAKRINLVSSSVSMVENKLQGGWVERTLTPIRGTFKHCGTDVMMENRGSKFYVATYEPSNLKKFLNNQLPKSFDFNISVKACNSNQIVNCKSRVHIVLAYKSQSNFLCLTGDFKEKTWRFDKFVDGNNKPTKIKQEVNNTLKSNKFYSVELQIRGALLYFKVNGKYLFDQQQQSDNGNGAGSTRQYALSDDEVRNISKIGLMCSRSKMIFKDSCFNIDGFENGITAETNFTKNESAVSNTNNKASLFPPVVPNGENRSTNRSSYTHSASINSQYDDKLKEVILKDLLLKIPNVTWDDIVGLSTAKRTLKEAVILPAMRPDLFKGLRSPPKGVLLFGPPGTGKTMLGKCVASVSKSSFFSISASTLTSKYHGEGEKLVRKLFEVARELQPSVIFIDEIDSLLSSRHTREHDAVRRLKTEFLIQFDGVSTNTNDRVLVMGATNRPQDLDDAVLRRMEKRIYIPLPDREARKALLKYTGYNDGVANSRNKNNNNEGDNNNNTFSLSDEELNQLVESTEGYSCSDIISLCKEASFGPLRDLGDDIMTAKATDMRAINYGDFRNAKGVVLSSVSGNAIDVFVQFNREYGGGG
jgi:SpoVK/Ycf46/Vps4 family AAA+-type ATPase